eukprot:1495422-Rhodomonas_salina.1
MERQGACQTYGAPPCTSLGYLYPGLRSTRVWGLGSTALCQQKGGAADDGRETQKEGEYSEGGDASEKEERNREGGPAASLRASLGACL